MASKAITVIYNGERLKIRDIALSLGMQSQTLLDRWHEAGDPKEITDEWIKSAKESRHKLSGVTYNGKPVPSCKDLAKQLGVSAGLVALRIKKHGKTLLPVHLASQKRIYEQRVEPLPIDYSDKSPGWLERQEFPDTGKNGFNKFDCGHFTGNGSLKMPVCQD